MMKAVFSIDVDECAMADHVRASIEKDLQDFGMTPIMADDPDVLLAIYPVVFDKIMKREKARKRYYDNKESE